jgi:hypothetical protein
MPTMASYAHILQDPARAQKVGSAITSIIDQLGSDETKQGGMINALENAGGLAAWKQQVQNNVVNKQLGDLNPEEREAVSSAITSLSTLVGFRALNKGSAAQFSVKALERDVPIMGYNVHTPAEYYAKLGRIAEIAKTGMDSTGGFQPKERQQLLKTENDMFKMAKDPTNQVAQKPASGAKFTPPPREPGVDGYWDPVQHKTVKY